MSASAISQSVRALEQKLGVQLLNRTTRHVRPTEYGSRFLALLKPGLDQIAAALSELEELRDIPGGLLRINLPRIAATLVVMPKLREFQRRYPQVRVELVVREEFTDLVAAGCDAGIRLGESLAKDMIAVRVSKSQRMAIVGSPEYFERRGRPQSPEELHAHHCMRYRFTGAGTLYRWELQQDAHELEVDPDGPLIVNDNDLMLEAARQGIGLAFVFRSSAAADLAAGRLEAVLEAWCPPFPGFYIYYPSAAAGRRQMPLKLRVFIDFLQSQRQDPAVPSA
jgi:DNA-binding transcriptional LysR family regulator